MSYDSELLYVATRGLTKEGPLRQRLASVAEYLAPRVCYFRPVPGERTDVEMKLQKIYARLSHVEAGPEDDGSIEATVKRLSDQEVSEIADEVFDLFTAHHKAASAERASWEKDVEQWLAIRKEAGLKINPETAQVEWRFAETLDPYGVDPDLPKECQQIGREYFARSPESDIWVHFHDLPDQIRDVLWERHKSDGYWSAESDGVFFL
jgi:hypothetical protein